MVSVVVMILHVQMNVVFQMVITAHVQMNVVCQMVITVHVQIVQEPLMVQR